MADLTTSANIDTLLQAASFAAARTSLSLGNVDNTSDATKNAAAVTLTNKTITGAANTISGITEAMLSTSDVTTLDVSISKHGFAPKLSNDVTTFLDGTGAYSVPGGVGGGNVSNTGTPTNGQMAQWTNATTIQGIATTGSGSAVLATAPTVSALTTTGIFSQAGASVLTGTAITSHVIDVTKIDNFESISANTTYTFSGTPAASNTVFGAKVTTDGTARTITIPSSISAAQNGATITSIIVPASTTAFFQWFYDGANYQITGDPVLTTGTGATYVLATSPTLVTPLLGTPTSGTLTTCTGLPISTGVSGLGTGAATALAANANATGGVVTVDGTATLTNKTLTSPTLTTPALGTPASGTLTNCTADGTNLLGYRGAPQNSQSAAYTTVLSDAGKSIFHPVGDNNARTFTIDSNANVAYVIGTIIEFINMAAASVTIAITSDSLVFLPAGSTGSRTLAQYGRASAEKITSTSWVISGNSALT